MTLISRARATPTRCGSSTVRPQPGITPTRECVSANRARSEATRKSQLSATSSPPVTATPLIAPISGFVRGGSAPGTAAAVVVAIVPCRRVGPSVVLARAELLEVDAGRERRIGAGEDHHVDGVIGFEFENRLRRAGS